MTGTVNEEEINFHGTFSFKRVIISLWPRLLLEHRSGKGINILLLIIDLCGQLNVGLNNSFHSLQTTNSAIIQILLY